MKYFTLLLINLFFLLLIACNTQEPKQDKTIAENKESKEKEDDYELAVHMGLLQRYLEKAYFAAEGGNDALHDFYIHEMEEEMESIQKAGVMDDGINVSYNMLHYGIKSLETYESRIEAEGLANFQGHFDNLINGCNSCHMVSKKPFIQIQKPSVNAFPSQKFTP
ncbi:hypothetical protein [Luteibaculum oceani]|uniref:Cytochrome c domain-containing protein n=1 Tax=Luteibaculum oceani TaxID=1294296 RepID=A0A5C6UQH6_9FLAO|nr:hypothetical protein [Luteibaculum oceani]TXC75592.1 hypothetical protein FRX97_11795 [Luteibaculum oceani]